MRNSSTPGMWLCCVIGFIWISTLMAGCGVKKPPVAPEAAPPEAISDLSYEKEGNAVTLHWTIPGKEALGSAGLGGFYIYQGEARLSDSACKDCPVLFHRIGQIGIENLYVNDRLLSTASYTVMLTPGFRYQFKVVVFSEDGLLSPDSNRVSVTFAK